MKQKPFIPKETAERMAMLCKIAREKDYNQKRVANALIEALELLEKELERAREQGYSEEALMAEAEQLCKQSCAEGAMDALDACLNTAQYSRGLAVCDMAEQCGALTEDGLCPYRAELFARKGNTEQAEETLLPLLETDPDDPWTYIRLGDVYMSYQMQEELMDPLRAEEWYYKGYDRGLASEQTEDGRALLERLGEACLKKMRFAARRALLKQLRNHGMGDWQTVAKLEQHVQLFGPECPFALHVIDRLCFYPSVRSEAESNRILEIVTDFLNVQPLYDRYSRCPMELVDLTTTPDIERIKKEMIEAWIERMCALPEQDAQGAVFSERFSEFQKEFYDGADPVTNKKRQTLLNRAYKKAERDIRKDQAIWTGFTRYRGAVKASEA